MYIYAQSVGPGSPQGSEGSQGEFGDLQMNIGKIPV